MQRGHRRADSAEVITINQIGVAIFAQGDNQVGRRGAGHVHNHWARAAEIGVAAVQRLPVSRHPVICGIAAKNRARLETNDRFAAAPGTGHAAIPSGNKQIRPIISNAPD